MTKPLRGGLAEAVAHHLRLNTTMIYVHVDKTHIEQAWAVAGRRAADRFGEGR